MKYLKIIFTITVFAYIVLGTASRAISLDKKTEQGSATSKDQTTSSLINRDNEHPFSIIYGTKENANTIIPPPQVLRQLRSENYPNTKQSQFIVTYTGFTDEAQIAFQYAVDIWDSLIRTPVPIRINATFVDLGGFDGNSIILGWARPAAFESPGPLNLLYVYALADMKVGKDLKDGEPDIVTKFNSNPGVNWYFGIDGNTPSDKMDFVTTVLHEIAHGLGFNSFARIENTFIDIFSLSVGKGKLRSGDPNFPQIYDFFVETGSGTALISFFDPSSALVEQFTSNNIFWNGKKAVEANGGIRPQLYAPSIWEQGSSYTHLDETSFPTGKANSLMTPYIDRQEAIHNPGDITLGMLEDMGWAINRTPIFFDGTTTTRTLPENAGVDVSIGRPVTATDDNSDNLTYQLSGTDAALFVIDSTTGQIKTKTGHNYNTKTSYTVTVTVSDGQLFAEIIVIIHVSNTVVDTPTNSAPVFIDGIHTTRSVAENTVSGVDIGTPVAATDADNHYLTYTLSGIDAASFEINSATGQLKTQVGLDYETKRTYTITIIVSDGNITVRITVTINVTDQDEQQSTPTLTLISQPLMETTLNGSLLTLKLSHRVYENWFINPVTITGITGVTVKTSNVVRVTDTELKVQLTFDGTDFDTNATLTFTVNADAIANYSGSPLIVTVQVTAAQESVNVSTDTPLTETTLNGTFVTLTLSGAVYESQYTVANNVSVSGITGVSVNRFNVVRINETMVRVALKFDGTDFDADATLTFTVKTDAIAGYNGTELVAQLPVSAVVEENPTMTASVSQQLTEITLNETVVTLTLSSAVYTQSSADISRSIQVSGIAGVTFSQSDVQRVSGTKVTVKLTFDGTDFDTDADLIFTVAAGAIENYIGTALTSVISVTAVIEGMPTVNMVTSQSMTEATLDGNIILLTLNNSTYVQSLSDIKSALAVSGIPGVTIKPSGVKRVRDTDITVELEFDGNIDADAILTFTVGADAIVGFDGDGLIVQVLVIAGEESVLASTRTPLTEATLNGSVVTLTLNGAVYERSRFGISDAITVLGVDGVTFHWFDLDRVSDTKLTVELTFNGNIDSDTTLTFTVDADAIAGYDGDPLITQLSVTALQESVLATIEAPLTEASLDGSVVTLTLSGCSFERSYFRIRDAVEVAGIEGVTIGTFGVDRVSDTQITVELDFNGDIDTDATLTFTVDTHAVLTYNGEALTTQLPVIAGQESIVVSTEAPLTEMTLEGSVVTLTLSGAKYASSIFDIRNGVSITGIEGVTIGTFGLDRVSDTEVTIELDYEGNMTADGTLTIFVGAHAIKNYGGDAFIAQISVTANTESVVASTAAPLTEASLDGSVVTLTLSGAKYTSNILDLRDGVSVSGISGVTIPWHDPDRKSDTEITIELEFDGIDFDTTSTLTFTVESDAIAGYNGPALTTQVSVSAVVESLVASSASPLTEATLDESVVTLTLSGAKYASSIFDIRDAVSISGITGVTVGTFDIKRQSDTEITVELTFDGDITIDSTLTFTVGADAIAGYNGTALTAQVTVTADRENVLLANFPNPFNPETWIPYQLAKPTEVTITIYAVNGTLVRTLALGHQPAGLYQNRSQAANWDGKNEFGEKVVSGLYFYTLTAGDFSATRKMLIRK